MTDGIVQQDRAIDAQIKARTSVLGFVPQQIDRRIVELKLEPDEVIRQIKQTNGIFIEIEKKRRG